ncbi:peptidoglycan bridge formation glycyltransferase FemA/FemB family protein [uncultured Finegoldia sp.]|uniref:lipid II:glycine glycyltransferase FemX n=1 Tax=uncultured Finegoldia sp. TaxID=328009 RepID=UPI0026038003|nr:peptidoglycan bridge formation glycyltransferase FemA/FemB family protein [uncultured Finegoldia sp.]
MSYEIVTLTKEQQDNFVKNHKYGELNQLYNWQFVKKGWIGKSVGIEKNGKLISTCLILFKKFPALPYYFAYAPKGPVVDYDNKDDVTATLNLLKQYCKRNKAFVLKFDPQVSCLNQNLIPFLKKLGCYHHGLKKGLAYTQPRFYMITDISRSEKDVMKSFQPRTRSVIKKSLKNGLICKKCDKSELIKFSKLMEITATRDGFNHRSHQYFENLFDALEPENDCELYLTKLIPTEVKKSNEEEIIQIQKDKKKTESKIEKDIDDEKKENLLKELDVLDNREKRCQDLINQMLEYSKDGVEEIVLSGAILTFCGKKSYYLYGASSNEFRDLSPNYLMQWTMIKRAIEKGCTSYDFGGVSGYTPEDNMVDHEAGLYEFKKRFGTEMLETIGEFDIVINKFINKFFEIALKLR